MKNKLSLIYILKTRCCPSCGKKLIFQSLLNLKKKCKCGLNLSNYDIGDAPSFFAMFFLNIFIVLSAILFEIKFSPPLILHIIIWTPLIIILSIFLIKYLKIFFLALNFKYRRDKIDN